MGQTLVTITSTTNPHKKHIITRGDDGVIYCDCWGWKKNRTCKHLEEFYENYPFKGLVLNDSLTLGDKVRLKKTSRYSSQHTGYGIITSTDKSRDLPYQVTWPDRYNNVYGLKDLEPFKHKLPENLEDVINQEIENLKGGER